MVSEKIHGFYDSEGVRGPNTLNVQASKK